MGGPETKVPQGFGASAPRKGIVGSSWTTPSTSSSSVGVIYHSGKNFGMGVEGSRLASMHGNSRGRSREPIITHLFHQDWSPKVLPLAWKVLASRPNAFSAFATLFPDSSVLTSTQTTFGRARVTPRLRDRMDCWLIDSRVWKYPNGRVDSPSSPSRSLMTCPPNNRPSWAYLAIPSLMSRTRNPRRLQLNGLGGPSQWLLLRSDSLNAWQASASSWPAQISARRCQPLSNCILRDLPASGIIVNPFLLTTSSASSRVSASAVTLW